MTSAKDAARRFYHDIAARLHNDICYGQLSWTIQMDAEHTLDCNEMTNRIAAAIEQAEARVRAEYAEADAESERLCKERHEQDRLLIEQAEARGREDAELVALVRAAGLVDASETELAEILLSKLRSRTPPRKTEAIQIILETFVALKRGGRE